MSGPQRATPQTGQVLVLGVVCLALLVLFFQRAFWVGDTSAARMRQNSATDTAAYSAALVQARLLNMLALLNRAYVAHHVASAHLATAASWEHFSLTQAEQFSRANPPASLIGLMFGSAYARAYAASGAARSWGDAQALQNAMQVAASAHAAFTNQLFGQLQRNLQTHFFELAQRNAHTVLVRNYPEQQGSSTLQLSITQQPYTVVATEAAQSFVAEWVRATAEQFGFLQPRNQTAKNTWSVSSRCPHLRHQLRRRGETRLDETGRWHSGDTLSFHALRSNRWVGCYYREYAMGYAWVPGRQGVAPDDPFSDDPPDNFSQQDFWRWVNSVAGWDLLGESANPLASSYGVKRARALNSARLQPVRVLASGVYSVSLQLQVVQPVATPAIHTSSAAETVFVAPRDSAQHANLFMPYWQPRLISAAKAEGGEP